MAKNEKQVGILGRNLARIMGERGIGPTKLARIAGLENRSTITAILEGRSPGSTATAETLAVALEIDVSELYGAPPRILVDMDDLIERWRMSDEGIAFGPLTAEEEAELRLRGPSIWPKLPTMRAVTLAALTIREALKS